MRITRDILTKIVRDTVAQRTRADRRLMSIYMCGSMLEDEFLLGGAADIDLVFVHSDQIKEAREIVHLTDEIHLDIAHHFHRDYRRTREIRVDPWLGPTLKSCKILYDPQHLMDFTQASVRGQFSHPDHILERARKQAEQARQIWLSFHETGHSSGPNEINLYLRAVEKAGNAVASLSGAPLTERKFLLNFQSRADAVSRTGLFPGLMGLIGAPYIDANTLISWIDLWENAYKSVSADVIPARLHPNRRFYYKNAFKEMLEGKQPMAALWPLERTWTLAVCTMNQDPEMLETWQGAFRRLGLLGEGFEERISALDAYLDMVEETLEKWGIANGANREN